MTQATLDRATLAAARSDHEVLIRCMGLTKVFRDFWMRNRVRAVDNIDLEVRAGEVFGLLGPNGSGKSTTIKMILGLLHPTSGRIAVMGKRPEDVASKKQIGYLPEESYLYRFLNARETLEYYGRLFHQSRPQRNRRIDMLLEMVGLEAVQRRPVGEYSKGMQRRIGLAQALINDPQLLILDEPTTGLDPIGTRQIKDLIVELARRGKTVLLCSHLLSDVEDVCDRVSIMFGGKIRAQGTVEQLLVKQDLTTIETSSLDEQTIERIEQVLRQQGKSINRVERPRQRLESLFLDIVQRAQAEGLTTSGARSGGKIAQFLVEDQDQGGAGDAAAKQVIDQLVRKTAKPQEASPQEANQPAAQPEPQAASQPAAQASQPSPAASPRTGPRAGAPAEPQRPAAATVGDMDLIQQLVQPGKQKQQPASQKPTDQTRDARPGQPPTPAGSSGVQTPSQPQPSASQESDSGEQPDTDFIQALEDAARKDPPRS